MHVRTGVRGERSEKRGREAGAEHFRSLSLAKGFASAGREVTVSTGIFAALISGGMARRSERGEAQKILGCKATTLLLVEVLELLKFIHPDIGNRPTGHGPIGPMDSVVAVP